MALTTVGVGVGGTGLTSVPHTLVIAGDTSGSVTLQVPAVANSTVLTLPATSGTVLTSVSPQSSFPPNIAGNGPAFSAYVGTTQTGLTSGVSVKIALNAEQFDTANCFDSTTNYRFTPNVSGYYQLNVSAYSSGSLTASDLQIHKNGAKMQEAYCPVSMGSAILSTTALIYCNGSTDYIEFYAYSTTSSGTWTIQALTAATCSGFLARSA